MVLAGTLVIAAGYRAFSDHWQVRNFHEVEPGAVYRGAEQRAGPLRRIIKDYGIRTIVCFVDPEPREQAVAQSEGVRWVGLPIGDSSFEATFDTLERFAELAAEPANQPVFYHCRRGVYRSNLAQAVYRIRACGWTLDEALNELEAIGFDPEERGGDNCCADLLRKYYAKWVGERAGRSSSSPEAN